MLFSNNFNEYAMTITGVSFSAGVSACSDEFFDQI